jgi:hypothetical protein
MLGFHLDFWDYITFAVLFFLSVSFLALLVFVLGLPGRIAPQQPAAANIISTHITRHVGF